MKVYEIMTIDVGSCSVNDDLSKAASIMWDKDCGIVPVVDAEMRVVGVVTDRDIAITAAMQNRRTSEILAGEISFRPVECCAMEDAIGTVLKRMAKSQVRRLPVIGESGELLGIISIADILGKAGKTTAKRAAKALRNITRRRDGNDCPEI